MQYEVSRPGNLKVGPHHRRRALAAASSRARLNFAEMASAARTARPKMPLARRLVINET
jgi:hypothetical protein